MEGAVALLYLMHRDAAPALRKKALEVLDTIFANILHSPSETKYRRINMTSVMWTRHVAPAFYIFRFIEWLASSGFEQDTEHSVLQLKCEDISGTAKAREGVRILLSAYVGSCSHDGIGRDQQMKRFLPRLRSVVGLGENNCCGGGNGRREDGVYARESFVSPASVVDDEIWEEVKNNLRVMVLHNVCCGRPSHECRGAVAGKESLLPCIDSAAWESISQVAPMLSLWEMEDAFSVVAAELFDARESYANTGMVDGGSLKVSVQKRVAERHRNALAHQKDKGTRIHAERHLVGARLIADIASCMEQIAALEDVQGMVRNDRLEAKRLLEKFNEDGDIVYLHQLKDDWSKRLEAVKQRCGKQFVYL